MYIFITFRFAVDDVMLEPFLQGMTLQNAIEAKRLFMTDLEILEGIKCKNGNYMVY